MMSFSRQQQYFHLLYLEMVSKNCCEDWRGGGGGGGGDMEN